MAHIRTPEEAARKILFQFRVANIRAGESLMRGAIKVKAQKEGLQSSDVTSGLQYAVENGWIVISNASFVRLTDVGFGEM